MLWCLSHVTHEPALKPADLFTKTARARTQIASKYSTEYEYQVRAL